ncbi:hypothetical protein FA95DRAFT_1611298 [Auriscalpium vulgare]|uniref:Uncharacterized protein n=1 Tax=Auriscalpium vulgare TaxID=40419 RepID=A0ACB8RAX1_9AGAM|nr:hypothetical protein FA95DRAFT_1611298 [Auriscalpium vulgare]
MSNLTLCVPPGIDPNNNPDGIYGIKANPDLSGIGIRVNFYLIILSCAITPAMPYTIRLLFTLFAHAWLLGIGLLFAVVIQTAQKQLSLYDALLVAHILWFLGIQILPADPSIFTSARRFFMAAQQAATLVVAIAWSLYMWLHTDTFGSQPACNSHVRYMFFFHSVPATTGRMPKVAAAFLIMESVGAAGVVAFLLGWAWTALRKQGVVFPGILPNKTYGLFIAVYATVNLELFVRRNKHLLVNPEESVWTLGQVLSLVMIFFTICEFIPVVFGLNRPPRLGFYVGGEERGDPSTSDEEQGIPSMSDAISGPRPGLSIPAFHPMPVEKPPMAHIEKS